MHDRTLTLLLALALAAGGLASAQQPLSVRLQEPLQSAPPPEATAPPPPAPSQAPPPTEDAGDARVPLAPAAPAADVQVDVEARNGKITLVARNAPLEQVLGLIAQETGINIVTGSDVRASISFTLRDVEIEDALTAILAVADCTWSRHNRIIHVTTNQRAKALPPTLQGRQLRVMSLDYAAADDTIESVRGMLSPVGQVFVRKIQQGNSRQSREAMVVEDLPQYVERIAAYVSQIDVPPRQVAIEARILQVELTNDNKHGVNLHQLANMAEDGVGVSMSGFANPAPAQAFTISLNGGKLQGLLECLKQTTDVKTLAAPQVIALNGQQAKIQIGEQLGFRVTTTTQTSSLESVEFLDVGVVLTVTPWITRDHRVMMHVKPEVSTGLVNTETGLPQEATTELDTNVLVNDGEGLIIGGLIQEEKGDTQAKVPKLGDTWVVGRLFQRREQRKRRSEIIVALIPRILHPDAPGIRPECGGQRLEQVNAPLFHGALRSQPRPWEPLLHDATGNPQPLLQRPLRPLPSRGIPTQAVPHETTVKTIEPICFAERIMPLTLPVAPAAPARVTSRPAPPRAKPASLPRPSKPGLLRRLLPFKPAALPPRRTP